MGYIVRKILPKEKDDVINIENKCIKKEFREIISKEDLVNIKSSISNIDNLYILEVDGKLVGFFKYNILNNIEITHLYIMDGYKGYGYGKVLFDYIKDTLKFSKFIIKCPEGIKANYFFLHMGGKVINHENVLIGNNYYPGCIYLFE